MSLLFTLLIGALLGALTTLFYYRKDPMLETGVAVIAAITLVGCLLSTHFEEALQFGLAYALMVFGAILGAYLRAKYNKKGSFP